MQTLVYLIAQAVKAHGGRAFMVGGCVRDELLGYSPKDTDLEFFGIAESDVEPLVRSIGLHVVKNGRSFPVWKAWDDSIGQANAIDIALPRREVRMGSRHTDFRIILDPKMSVEDASSRRDFTINAILKDPLTGEIIDLWGGRLDLQQRRLRHVSAHFGEDPLRVLRGMQFAGRFSLMAEPETVDICRQLVPDDLPRERLWEEWKKLILKSERPSCGLRFLAETGWICHFPELAALVGVQQNPAWHPEGDAWMHTLHCMDAFAQRRTGNEAEDLIVGLAVLCHDLGKPSKTAFVNGRWTAHDHEEAGEPPTRSFLGRLTVEADIVSAVVPLVTNHMVPKNLLKQHQQGENTDRAVRRLAVRVRLDRLARVCWCDSAGRPPKEAVSPDAEWLLDASERLAVKQSRPVPLVQGRDLIAAGFRPGPHFGPVLQAVYEAQLDGNVSSKDEALSMALKAL